MIDLTIDPKTQSIRDMIRWIGKEHLRPLGLECDERHGPLPSDHPFFLKVQAMSPMSGGGLGAVAESADAGKSGDDKKPRNTARRTVVVAEEGAYWDRGMLTSMPGAGLAGAPLRMVGTPEQQKRFMGLFEDKSRPHWAAFGMTEPGAGSDVARIRTSAKRVAGGWVLNGEKCFCSNGARADWVLVWATTDANLGRAGHRAFIVEKGTPGFELLRIEKKMGLCASETANLKLDDVRVPDENLLGGEQHYKNAKEGFKTAMKAFDLGRTVVASLACGMGQAALDETARFIKESGLATSQTAAAVRVRDKYARARRLVEHGRLLAWRAAWLADHRKVNSLEASMAKAYAPRAALEAASLGIEALGAAGARCDRLIEKLYRDVKVLDIVEGTGQIQRLAMARRLLGYTDGGEAAESA